MRTSLGIPLPLVEVSDCGFFASIFFSKSLILFCSRLINSSASSLSTSLLICSLSTCLSACRGPELRLLALRNMVVELSVDVGIFDAKSWPSVLSSQKF